MTHHVDGERAREPWSSRQLLGEGPVEGLHQVVEQLLVGVDSVEGGPHLLVHPVDHVGREQSFDDDGAVPFDAGDDVLGVGRGVEPQ